MVASLRSPSLPSKSDRVQSALSERAYRAAALAARVFNVLCLPTAYQAELCEDYARACEPAVWEEIPVIADLCLRVHRCAVQTTGKVMGTLVLQESAWWLNLANLSDREKDDIRSFQRGFLALRSLLCIKADAKNKEDEALQLCLPRKPSGPPPTVRRKEFPPGLQPLPPRMRKRSKPAPVSPALTFLDPISGSCGTGLGSLWTGVCGCRVRTRRARSSTTCTARTCPWAFTR